MYTLWCKTLILKLSDSGLSIDLQIFYYIFDSEFNMVTDIMPAHSTFTKSFMQCAYTG
jgi:hypothetical protein